MRGKFPSMTWTRSDTQEWIIQIQHRIEDIDYYIMRTVEWCERNGIWADEKVIACMVVTVLWVSHMRNEEISRKEIFEILGFPDEDKPEDGIYQLNAQMLGKELEELLDDVIRAFGD